MNEIMINIILVIVALLVVSGAIYGGYVFYKMPRQSQIASIKAWLLYAVVEAEKALGSGTGQLKLRFVYNMFIEKFGALATVITFEMFDGLVDEVLEEMRQMLSTNTAVADYVNGTIVETIESTTDKILDSVKESKEV